MGSSVTSTIEHCLLDSKRSYGLCGSLMQCVKKQSEGGIHEEGQRAGGGSIIAGTACCQTFAGTQVNQTTMTHFWFEPDSLNLLLTGCKVMVNSHPAVTWCHCEGEQVQRKFSSSNHCECWDTLPQTGRPLCGWRKGKALHLILLRHSSFNLLWEQNMWIGGCPAHPPKWHIKVF